MKNCGTKRLLCLLLACLMTAAGTAGCQGQPQQTIPPATTGSTDNTGATTQSEPEAKGVQFPLTERFKFSIMFKGNIDFENQLPKVEYYQKLVEDTNVEFEWIQLGTEPMATLNAMLAAGTEGDVIFGGVLNDSNLSDLSAGGFLLPIEDYVTDPDIMPNYVSRGIAQLPEVVGVMSLPDGHIYSLARINALPAVYLESPMRVNDKWLEQVGMKAPETIEQFTDMLRAFRDNDLNGNGNPNDEIPLLISDGVANPYAHVQALLGMWGIATKNNAQDSYTTIRDGIVELAPMSEAYKAAMKTIGGWFKEGLIWSEALTANAETFNAKINSEIAIFGACPIQTIPITATYYDEMIAIPYPKVEGYETRAYYNPGYMGYKNTFTLTRNAKNPEVILAWIDQIYSLEGTLGVEYNLPGPGNDKRYDFVDGKYIYRTLTAEESSSIKENSPSLLEVWGAYISLRAPEDYANNYINIAANTVEIMETYENLYKDVINPEIWPRPYYSAEDSSRAAELRTDVFNIISTYEAKWVTGQSDIDKDWDGYLKELKAAGVDELVQILQRSYDIFLQSMEKYK